MTGKSVTLALAVLMLTTMFVVPFGTEEVSALDPPDGVTSNWYTNWTITTALTYHPGTRVSMIGWNVTIKNGGSLTLDMTRIYMFGNFTSQIGVTVESGGTLIMLNDSRIYGSATGFGTWCDFQAGSSVDITNSRLTGCDGKGPNMAARMGIHLAANNSRINSTLMIQVNVGIPNFMTIDGTGNKITNNSIGTDTTATAIVVNNGNEFSDNLITRIGGSNVMGLDLTGTGTTSLFNNQISGYQNGLWIASNRQLNVVAKGNSIYLNSNHGIYVDNDGYTPNVTLVSNTIRNNGINGIHAYYATLSMSQNTIHNNSLIGLDTNLVTLKSDNDKFADNPNYNLNLVHSKGTIANATIVRNSGITSGKSVLITENSNVTIRDSNIPSMPVMSSHLIQVMSGSTAKFYNNFMSNDFILAGVYGGSTAYFENNNFTSPTSIGLYGSEYSSIETKNNTFNGCAISLGIVVSSSLVSNADTIWSASPGGAGLVLDSSTGVVHDMRTTLGTNTSSVAINPSGGSAELYDCTFSPVFPKVLNAITGHILSVSSSPTTADVTVGLPGVVDIGWYAEVATKWQNDATAPNATVLVNDTSGTTMANVKSDFTGITPRSIVIQSTVDASAIHSHNDYRATATLNGMTGQKTFTADKDLLGADRVVVNLNDNANPLINIIKPDSSLITNNATVRINGTASDQGSDLAKVQVDIGSGFVDATGLNNWEMTTVVPEGNATIIARAVDIAGNMAAASVNIVVDLTKPNIIVNEPTALYLRNGDFWLNGTTEASTTVVTVDGAPATMTGSAFSIHLVKADGDYTFTINATDLAGNKNTATKHVIVDTVPPDLTVDLTDGTYFNKADVNVTGWTTGDTVTINGELVTIDPVRRTYSKDMTLVEGPNTVTVNATDLAGNMRTVEVTINIDTLPPEIVVTSPSGTITTNMKALIIAGTVTGASALELDGGALTYASDGSFNTTVTLVSGENTFTIKAKDLAGNTAEETVTAILDDIAPVVTITSPADGFATKESSVTVTGTVDDASAILTFGGNNVTNSNGAFTLTVSLTNGTTPITVTATDLAGNSDVATIAVIQDASTDLTITSQTEKEYKTKDDKVNFKGTSEPGAKVYINDALVSAADGTFNYDWPLKPGENKITVKVVDAAGNEKSETYTITKEKETEPVTSKITGGNNMLLAIILLIVGIAIGAIVGYVAGRPKAKAPPMDERPYSSKPAKGPVKEEPAQKFEPVEEEEEEAPEEAEEEKAEEEEEEPEEPKPEPKKEAPKAVPPPAKAEVKAAPKAEPKPEPKKEAPKKEVTKSKMDSDLDDILEGLK